MAACPWGCWILGPEDCKKVDCSTGNYTAGACDDVEGDFVLAEPMSLNLRAMAATAWSLPLLPATPADPLAVKVKRHASLDLLLLLQEVAGLRMTSCNRQSNSVS